MSFVIFTWISRKEWISKLNTCVHSSAPFRNFRFPLNMDISRAGAEEGIFESPMRKTVLWALPAHPEKRLRNSSGFFCSWIICNQFSFIRCSCCTLGSAIISSGNVRKNSSFFSQDVAMEDVTMKTNVSPGKAGFVPSAFDMDKLIEESMQKMISASPAPSSIFFLMVFLLVVGRYGKGWLVVHDDGQTLYR